MAREDCNGAGKVGQGVCICVCVCVMQRRVLREEVAGIARPVGVRLRGRKALGAEKPLPHPGHPGNVSSIPALSLVTQNDPLTSSESISYFPN